MRIEPINFSGVEIDHTFDTFSFVCKGKEVDVALSWHSMMDLDGIWAVQSIAVDGEVFYNLGKVDAEVFEAVKAIADKIDVLCVKWV